MCLLRVQYGGAVAPENTARKQRLQVFCMGESVGIPLPRHADGLKLGAQLDKLCLRGRGE